LCDHHGEGPIGQLLDVHIKEFKPNTKDLILKLKKKKNFDFLFFLLGYCLFQSKMLLKKIYFQGNNLFSSGLTAFLKIIQKIFTTILF